MSVNEHKKSAFADLIIALCILACAAITVDVIVEYHLLGIAIPYTVVEQLRLMWTGELLILAGRQIFGSDVITKAVKAVRNDDTEDRI